eukprot:5105781-Prymnesium_polylepis.1
MVPGLAVYSSSVSHDRKIEYTAAACWPTRPAARRVHRRAQRAALSCLETIRGSGGWRWWA